MSKKKLRKRYLNLRKKKYYDITKEFFLPLLKLLNPIYKKKKIKLGLYFPSNFEINVLKVLDYNYINKQNIFAPVIEQNNSMNFFSWKKNDVLLVNKFGILEPLKKSSPVIPEIILVPVLAFDNNKCRLGYGKGFYDRYLNKYLNKFKNIISIGVAFSFQKYHKLPTEKNDVKLNYILTEKGIY
tara:strand:- start:479 stop:1030 length:552 start_codon:yes stop_codon:yes gene_type:complete